jgi:ubiquinone/menaquinone biosynthesis C-methylase UbiE
MINKKYLSPIDFSNLSIVENHYVDESGNKFSIENGIVNFIYPPILSSSDLDSIKWYQDNAKNYDEYLPLTFETFKVSETLERNKLIQELKLSQTDIVLEVGCGTGRDSEIIANQLGKDGELYLQDISPEILNIAVQKFKKLSFDPKIYFSLANSYYLPFGDHTFDKVFHFGGLNTFGDIKRFFLEAVRVTKPGGRIVVGDESMPPWLRETDFGKILMNSNHHYKFDLPLNYLPVEARNVKLEWFIGGVFYFISFDVGVDEPFANFDFEIPGIRGGTHRTRYYGNLEGLSKETIELAKKAREKSGKSMYNWLNEAVLHAAINELNNE